MARLNRELCGDLVDEFADYEQSENDVTLSEDGKKLIRQFVEAVAFDDAVRERFDALVASTDEETVSDSSRRGNNGSSQRSSQRDRGNPPEDGSREQLDAYLAARKKAGKMAVFAPSLKEWQKLTPSERKKQFEEIKGSSTDNGGSSFKLWT